MTVVQWVVWMEQKALVAWPSWIVSDLFARRYRNQRCIMFHTVESLFWTAPAVMVDLVGSFLAVDGLIYRC